MKSSTRTRVLLLASVSVIAIAAAIWAATNRSARNSTTQQKARTEMASMAGMDMSGDGSVSLTADQIRQFGITFGSVEQRTLTDRVRAVGNVVVDERRMAGVAAKFNGYVEHLYVDFTGKSVSRGEPLLEIYSPELVAAQNELLLAARIEREGSAGNIPGVPQSSNLLSAARQRLRLWDISETQVDQVLRDRKASRTLTLFAPASGVVLEKNVLVGQAVQPGQALYTIADLSRVWIETELREADAGTIRLGMSASLEIASYPGRPIEAHVEFIDPVLRGETRALRVRLSVANRDGRIKPGMYATVWLSVPQRATLTVPLSALLRTGDRQIVFVDMGNDHIMPHQVVTGRIAGDLAEVISGLVPGQRVVTSAQFLLDSESNLADVMRSMVSQMNMSGMTKER